MVKTTGVATEGMVTIPPMSIIGFVNGSPVLDATETRAGTAHDPHSGQFTSGGGASGHSAEHHATEAGKHNDDARKHAFAGDAEASHTSASKAREHANLATHASPGSEHAKKAHEHASEAERWAGRAKEAAAHKSSAPTPAHAPIPSIGVPAWHADKKGGDLKKGRGKGRGLGLMNQSVEQGSAKKK